MGNQDADITTKITFKQEELPALRVLMTLVKRYASEQGVCGQEKSGIWGVKSGKIEIFKKVRKTSLKVRKSQDFTSYPKLI